jgi:hypothetical protein
MRYEMEKASIEKSHDTTRIVYTSKEFVEED